MPRLTAKQIEIDGVGRAKKKPQLRLCGDPAEGDVLRTVLEFLRLHPSVAWAQRMNAGKGFLSPRRGGDGRWIEFGFAGCADILGQMRDGRLLACECKSARGVVSQAQQQFIETVKANGGVACVVRSLDDVIRLLSD